MICNNFESLKKRRLKSSAKSGEKGEVVCHGIRAGVGNGVECGQGKGER